MLEVESYRTSAARLVGSTIDDVDVRDPYWARDAPDLADAVVGCRVEAADRHGKVLLLRTDGPTIGLRFGMTGRLVVDGVSAVPELVYGAHGDDPAWIRLVMTVGERTLLVSDPRRLGRVELDPDLDDLGPDAWGIDGPTLAARLGRSARPVKVALLDQHAVAGIGNMIADEVLFRAGIDPRRRARDVEGDEWDALAAALGEALPSMMAAGGSHTGLLAADLRREGAPCPLDGTPLRRFVLGGRSAYVCCSHQR